MGVTEASVETNNLAVLLPVDTAVRKALAATVQGFSAMRTL